MGPHRSSSWGCSALHSPLPGTSSAGLLALPLEVPRSPCLGVVPPTTTSPTTTPIVPVLTKLLQDLRQTYGADEQAAKEVLGLITKEKPSDRRSRGRARSTPDKPKQEPAKKSKDEPKPAEAAAWAQMGCTLLNLEAAIRRG